MSTDSAQSVDLVLIQRSSPSTHSEAPKEPVRALLCRALAAKASLALAACLVTLHLSAQELPKPKITKPQVEMPLRVLLIGNSYFYYNHSLHNHIKRMLASGNPAPKESDIDYKSATISGASLAHQPVEWLVTPGQLGVKEGFQLVILADGSAAPLSDARRIESRRLIREHAATIRKHGGQVALYMTHAYAAPHRQTKPQNLTATARHYIEAANEIDALVIPVALAFEEAYRQRPNVSLHMTYDGSHPNALGTYLAACVTFSSIYSQPCKGNIYNYFGQFSPEEIAFLQSVSDTVVQRFFNR
ncbi:MAG: SGNH/GDSL hydrolase family protein [Betaproteobacteria bacterium]|nr:SGNH/GDSL hydrolase family protein [Betaproteobacteria bacterium]